jgi:hypothetical protein
MMKGDIQEQEMIHSVCKGKSLYPSALWVKRFKTHGYDIHLLSFL